MTADDLRTLLRTDVLADEPHFGMTSGPVVAEGRRVVRRRRIVAGLGTLAAVAVTAGAAVSLMPGTGGPDRAVEVPTAAQEVLDSFDRDTFPALFDAEVRAAAGGAIPAGVEGLIEPTFDGWTRVRPEDYRFTDAWTGWYDLSPTNELMVSLRRTSGAETELEADAACELYLAEDSAERCTSRALGDGSVVSTQVLEQSRTRRGHFTGPKDDADTRWYQRLVTHRRAYGFSVSAREYVKAPSLDAADELWLLSTEQLAAIATAPRLVYELPTEPRECNPTYFMPEEYRGIARAACEEYVDGP